MLCLKNCYAHFGSETDGCHKGNLLHIPNPFCSLGTVPSDKGQKARVGDIHTVGVVEGHKWVAAGCLGIVQPEGNLGVVDGCVLRSRNHTHLFRKAEHCMGLEDRQILSYPFILDDMSSEDTKNGHLILLSPRETMQSNAGHPISTCVGLFGLPEKLSPRPTRSGQLNLKSLTH